MFSHDQYDALLNGAGLLDRRSRGRLQLTGADRRDYLQGLLTNDIAALSPGRGCYAALLTAQGRMLSDMHVSELGDRIVMIRSIANARGPFSRDLNHAQGFLRREYHRGRGHTCTPQAWSSSIFGCLSAPCQMLAETGYPSETRLAAV